MPDVHWHDELDSTMDPARELAMALAPAGTTVVAETQRLGRGRNGRTWASPRGAGIYLTAIVRPTSMAGLSALSPAVALALTALGPFAGLAPLLVKWPNDLLGSHGKVGGLLLEQAADRTGRLFVLVGLGLNLRTPALQAGPSEGPPPVPPSSLHKEGATDAALANPRALVARVVALMGEVAAAWEHGGPALDCSAYDRAHAWHGRRVVALGGGPNAEDLAGVVAGIAPDGSLGLECSGQRVWLRSATLRLAAGEPGLRQ